MHVNYTFCVENSTQNVLIGSSVQYTYLQLSVQYVCLELSLVICLNVNTNPITSGSYIGRFMNRKYILT